MLPTYFRLKPLGLLALSIMCTATVHAISVDPMPSQALVQLDPFLSDGVSTWLPGGMTTIDYYDFYLTKGSDSDPSPSTLELPVLEALSRAMRSMASKSTDPINAPFMWSTVDGTERKVPEPLKVRVLLEGGSRTHEFVFTFQANKGILTGTVTAPNGTMPIYNGKIDGNRISFAVKLIGGQLTSTAVGLISGDELNLSTTTAGRTFQLTAKRINAPAGTLKFNWFDTE